MTDKPSPKETPNQNIDIGKDFWVLSPRGPWYEERMKAEMKLGTFPKYILNPAIPDNPWDRENTPGDDAIWTAEINNQTPIRYSALISEELTLMLDPKHNPWVAWKDVLSLIKDNINNGSLSVMDAWREARSEWRKAESKFNIQHKESVTNAENAGRVVDKELATAALKNANW